MAGEIIPNIDELDQQVLRVTDPFNYEQDYSGPNYDWSGRIVVVLGAGDPEMDAIVRRCERHRIPYAYARIEDKNDEMRRVKPAEAYKGRLDEEKLRKFGGRIVTIECAIIDDEGNEIEPYAAVDHHGKRSPDGDRSYKHAVEASALGQFAALLSDVLEEEIELSDEEKTIAALDHCAGRILHGDLEDIDPQLARQVMVHEIARGKYGNPVPTEEKQREVNDMIDGYIANELKEAKAMRLGETEVYDLTDVEFDEPGYSEGYLSLKVAAAIDGKAALVKMQADMPDNPEMYVLVGYVLPKQVDQFGETWAAANGADQPEPILDRDRGIAMVRLPGQEESEPENSRELVRTTYAKSES